MTDTLPAPTSAPTTRDPLADVSRTLAPGAIRPQGWLRDQLRLQADGLTGRLEEVWPDVGPDSGWLGGPGERWERGPYYLDGLVPLAHVLGDERLRDLAAKWIEWMLGSQDETGFFGPADRRDWWPRMVAVKVLAQHAEATGDARVVPFLERWFRYQLRELPGSPLWSWGRVRGADAVLGVWWLHDRTGEDWLLELVDLLESQTDDWDAYLGGDLITGPARIFRHVNHGPNVAMGLKTGAVASLRHGDRAGARDRAERSWAALERWHGQAHGFFSGDEWLAGREATAGIETCQVVELMFTLEQQSRILGGGVYGDRLEAAAFNLLAASCDPRMLAHQYHQQGTQVQVSTAQRPWSHSTDGANVFGLEPHFGCCTANLHQGWPKLATSLWMQDADGGLRAVAWAPATVEAEVDGRAVRLDVRTDYPFDETIEVRVDVDAPTHAALRLRIPAWADDARLAVDGVPVELGEGAAGGGIVDGHVELAREWHGGETIELVLPMRVRVERRERQAVSLRLGPLVLVLSSPENWIPVPGAPGLAEWEVHPRGSWNYALTELDRVDEWVVTRRAPGPVPFALDDVPVRVRTDGATVHAWHLDGAQAAPPPPSPVFDAGPSVHVSLVPYGSARIRVLELPWVAVREPEEE